MEPQHCYIFHGPDGVGKRHTALQFFKELCKARMEEDRWEIADTQITRGTYQDLIVLEPGGQSYGIAQMQEMIEDAQSHPKSGPYKMFILERSSVMTPNAANALLKILEDSPPTAIFVFLIEDEMNLIPTIRSRSVSLRFSSLDTDTIKGFLLDYDRDVEKVQLCANLCGGSIGVALSYLRGGDLVVRDSALDLLLQLHRKPAHQVLDIVENEENPRLLFYLLRHILADLARLQVGLDSELTNFDKIDDLRLIQTRLGGAVNFGIKEMNDLYARENSIKATFTTHLKCSLLQMRRSISA